LLLLRLLARERGSGYRTGREERLRDRVTRPVDPGEQLEERSGHRGSRDVVDLAVLEVGAEPAEDPLGRAGRPRDPVDRGRTGAEAVERCPRERGGADELLGDCERLERRAVAAHVRLERAAGLEQRDELVGAHRVVLREADGNRIARADDTYGRRGALEVQAELEELVRLAVRHGRVGTALEAVRPVPKLLEERVRAANGSPAVRAADDEEQPVDRLPHLTRDLLPDGAGVLAREGDAARDGARVAVVPEHPLGDVLRRVRVVVLAVRRLIPEERDDPLPGLAVVGDLGVEEGVVVDVEQARAVLRALDEAPDPVERLRDPAQHPARPWSASAPGRRSRPPPPDAPRGTVLSGPVFPYCALRPRAMSDAPGTCGRVIRAPMCPCCRRPATS
jgi:hypothetical protein